jgi:predicted RNA-binding protein YlqC (UPF0109 family)
MCDIEIKKIDDLCVYVLEIVKQFIDFPEELNGKLSITTKTIIIQLECAKSDLGKIIGKTGRSINALQTIISAVKNTKFPSDNKKIIIEVLE